MQGTVEVWDGRRLGGIKKSQGRKKEGQNERVFGSINKSGTLLFSLATVLFYKLKLLPFSKATYGWETPNCTCGHSGCLVTPWKEHSRRFYITMVCRVI